MGIYGPSRSDPEAGGEGDDRSSSQDGSRRVPSMRRSEHQRFLRATPKAMAKVLTYRSSLASTGYARYGHVAPRSPSREDSRSSHEEAARYPLPFVLGRYQVSQRPLLSRLANRCRPTCTQVEAKRWTPPTPQLLPTPERAVDEALAQSPGGYCCSQSALAPFGPQNLIVNTRHFETH